MASAIYYYLPCRGASPSFDSGTTLYCLVTEAHVYATWLSLLPDSRMVGVEPATFES